MTVSCPKPNCRIDISNLCLCRGNKTEGFLVRLKKLISDLLLISERNSVSEIRFNIQKFTLKLLPEEQFDFSYVYFLL